MTALFKKMFGTQDDFQTRMRVHEMRQEGMACGKKGDYTDGLASVLTLETLKDPGLVVFPSVEFLRECKLKAPNPVKLKELDMTKVDEHFPAEEREQARILLWYVTQYDQQNWNWKTGEWDWK